MAKPPKSTDKSKAPVSAKTPEKSAAAKPKAAAKSASEIPAGEKPGRRRGNRGRTPSGNPNPIDVHVGSRVRLRRTLMGMSQEKLGEALGLTFQQVQKYERGANRVGASRLFDLARVLDVSVGFFFDDMTDEIKAQAPSKLTIGGVEETAIAFEHDPLTKRETLELVRAYYRIADPSIRKRVYELAKALADPLPDGK